MGLRRGVLRIATAIRALGYGTAVLIVLGCIIGAFDKPEWIGNYMAGAILGGGAVAGLAWGIAWLLEGFAPELDEDPRWRPPPPGGRI